MTNVYYVSSVPWYSYHSSVKKVIVSNGVTSIGDFAFYDCSSLTSITIPDTVTSIRECAFCGCSSLTNITIPDSVTSIGYGAFYKCSSLTSITIPDSVTSIGGDTFYKCSSLTSKTIPKGVKSIGYQAFYDCSSLTSITIPDSVTSIGEDAFYYCSNLTDIHYTGSEEQWSAINTKSACIPYNCTIHFNAIIISPIARQTYTGSPIKPAVTVKSNGKTLTFGKDYTVSYKNNSAVGKANVTVTGTGNYLGKTATAEFMIKPRDISKCTISAIANKTYTGSAIKPEITVKNGTKTITKGTSYTVSYKNNTAVGTATVTVTGKGNFTGTTTVTFKIVPRNINDCTIVEIADQQYTGLEIIPDLTVTFGSKTLTKGTSYTVTSQNNIERGTATLTITGKNNYTGTRTLTFKIVRRDISSCTVSEIASKIYTGSAITPSITVKFGAKTLTAGISYSVSYKNNTQLGTATITINGLRNYTGTTTKTFSIGRDISDCTISAIANQTYTGSAITPSITVKFGAKTLTAGISYSVSYKNNTQLGTATITITGLNNYAGTKTATFKIVPRNISECTIAKIADQQYTGIGIIPSLTVKFGDKSLTKGTSYTVTGQNNIKRGTATLTIMGKNN